MITNRKELTKIWIKSLDDPFDENPASSLALEVVLDFLNKQGFALVPLMPTDAMIKAGHEAPDEPECAEPASIFLSAANGAGNILKKAE